MSAANVTTSIYLSPWTSLTCEEGQGERVGGEVERVEESCMALPKPRTIEREGSLSGVLGKYN